MQTSKQTKKLPLHLSKLSFSPVSFTFNLFFMSHSSEKHVPVIIKSFYRESKSSTGKTAAGKAFKHFHLKLRFIKIDFFIKKIIHIELFREFPKKVCRDFQSTHGLKFLFIRQLATSLGGNPKSERWTFHDASKKFPFNFPFVTVSIKSIPFEARRNFVSYFKINSFLMLEN